jgi:hypothetical protein
MALAVLHTHAYMHSPTRTRARASAAVMVVSPSCRRRPVCCGRCGGVLEAVRVARLGYPVRLPHAHFISQYRCIVAADVIKANAGTLPMLVFCTCHVAFLLLLQLFGRTHAVHAVHAVHSIDGIKRYSC